MDLSESTASCRWTWGHIERLGRSRTPGQRKLIGREQYGITKNVIGCNTGWNPHAGSMTKILFHPTGPVVQSETMQHKEHHQRHLGKNHTASVEHPYERRQPPSIEAPNDQAVNMDDPPQDPTAGENLLRERSLQGQSPSVSNWNGCWPHQEKGQNAVKPPGGSPRGRVETRMHAYHTELTQSAQRRQNATGVSQRHSAAKGVSQRHATPVQTAQDQLGLRTSSTPGDHPTILIPTIQCYSILVHPILPRRKMIKKQTRDPQVGTQTLGLMP